VHPPSTIIQINDKHHPNLTTPTTSIHNSSGYAGGAAQIPWTNDVNDKSRPNSTMNIQKSKILQVLPKALPKFNGEHN